VIVRPLLILLGMTTSVQAWEFTPGLPCLLTHATSEAAIKLTHDPAAPLYSITITRQFPWPEGPVFAIRFNGSNGLTISTDRHVFSDDRRGLTVTDRGFGNVLNGMEFNDSATAMLGQTQVEIPLQGAAGPVAAFRVCKGAPGV
jgi:hypothetical protein